MKGDEEILLSGPSQPTARQDWKKYRFLALFLAILGGLGPNVSIVVVTPLMEEILEAFDISVTKFMIFITAASIPNVICPVLAGIFADIIGRGKIFIPSLCVLLVGTIVAWIAVMHTQYWLLIIGGILISVGSQCYLVVIGALESIWFKNKETVIALALDSAVSYTAVALIYIFVPVLYESTKCLAWPFFLSVIAALISIVAASALFFLDKLAVPEPEEKGEELPPLGINSIKNLGFIFLYLLISYSGRAMGFSLFEFTSSGYFQERFGFTLKEADMIISIPYICFFLLNPIAGVVIYYIGRKPFIMGISGAFMCIFMAWIGLIPTGNHVTIALLPYTLYSVVNVIFATAFWPCLNYAIPQKFMGLGFGVVMTTMNFMVSIGSLIQGLIHDASLNIDAGYGWQLAFILCWMIISLFACYKVTQYDIQHTRILDISEKKIKEKKATSSS